MALPLATLLIALTVACKPAEQADATLDTATQAAGDSITASVQITYEYDYDPALGGFYEASKELYFDRNAVITITSGQWQEEFTFDAFETTHIAVVEYSPDICLVSVLLQTSLKLYSRYVFLVERDSGIKLLTPHGMSNWSANDDATFNEDLKDGRVYESVLANYSDASPDLYNDTSDVLGRWWIFDEESKTLEPTEYFIESQSNEVSYKVSGEWDNAKLKVSVRTPQGVLTSNLTMPKGKYVINPGQWQSSHMGRPSVGLLPGRDNPTLWVLCTDLVGVHETIYLQLFQWKEMEWKEIPAPQESDASTPAFTNRGGFMVHKGKLVVWDAAYDGLDCNQCPQPYDITFWEVNNHKLHRVKTVRTQKRYQPEGIDLTLAVPHKVIPENDPLREVGLQWTWWDDVKSKQERSG